MSWDKISEKLYSIRLNDKMTDIECPYGKVEAVFKAFVGAGGIVTDEGVQTDIVGLINNFAVVGDIILTKYDDKGKIVEEGNCRNLSASEISELFEIGSDIVEGFLNTISKLNQKKNLGMVDEKGSESKTKKD